MDYEITKATQKDVELLKKLSAKIIFNNNKDKLTSDQKKEIIGYINNDVNNNYKKYNLILGENKIIGILHLSNYKSDLLLDKIYLYKRHRNKGIGSKIITDILITNNKSVYLWIYKTNQKALSLYQKLGFKIKKETETRYFMKNTNQNLPK